MSAIYVNEGIDVLRQASCLTSCSFIFEQDCRGYTIPGNSPPIVNSTLEKLHADFSKSSMNLVRKFANVVTLPSLQELSFRTSMLRSMMSLFQRSHCRLRTFSLILDKNVPEDDVLMLLSILPSVEHFTLKTCIMIQQPVITNKFFNGLRDPRFKPSDSSVNPILPKLKSLSYTGEMQFTWLAFLEMFPPPGNFLAAGRPLSEVSLKLYLPKNFIGDLGVITKLREIQQSKIKLVVTDSHGEDLL